ncbi:LytTR family DNA-binding domain-containing protein [Portibacter lacus]|uniref:HTH LytTR-type domain-containing protein n=1 Tax=Portibacter lacus TaxID=1099794 RepID=A0AA37WG40_9BACT|nr:LytTR family DNA-binding domain-containing protein [Portibacter lacus]GLR17625.1 hypothetical protein GCM10007940_22400 [Portibacter lacus]
MLKWLKKPYPFLVNPVVQLALSMLVGLICFLFLLVFRPFGLEQVDDVTYIFGFGVIGFLVLGVHYFIFPRIFRRYFDEEQWTIWKQLLLFASIIFLIGSGIYIYNSTIGLSISPQYSLGRFIYFAFAVGILPIIFMTYFIEKVAAQRNITLAQSIELSHVEEIEKSILVKSENQSEEDLELKISQFIYAKASGNYSEIYFYTDLGVEHRLMRVTLKSVQDLFESGGRILRCHKSYLINKDHIESVEGNARSLMLKLTDIPLPLPISRSISKADLE